MTAEPRVLIHDRTAQLWAALDAVGFLRAMVAGEVDGGGAERTAHAEHVGNRLTGVPAAGQVVMAWTPGRQLANLSGAVHGGYLALVCDEAAGLAAASTGERFVPMLTLDLDVTYLRPGVVGEEHRVEGRVLHTGRARLVSEARVVRADGKVAATARGSFLPNTAFVERVAATR